MIKKNSSWREHLLRLRYVLGYSLFALAIGYSLYNAPNVAWQIKPIWHGISIIVILIMFFLEVTQFSIFLHHHEIKFTWMFPALFTTRKGVMNAILPARAGTLVLLHSITQHYGLKWHDYLRFMLVASISSLIISAIVTFHLFLDTLWFVIISLATIAGAWISSYLFKESYFKSIPILMLNSSVLYIGRLIVFWLLLRGLGFDVTLLKSSYFAVAMNILSQISITPGNIGVREFVLGFLSPYLDIPMSVGGLVGTIFLVWRMILYAILQLVLERIKPNSPSQQSTPDLTGVK